MILRRVMKHVRNQEWTAVFLDFIIVVMGIFVGLQVANWSVARADRALEHEYLERLLADVENSITSTQYTRAFMVEHSNNGILVLDSLLKCDLPEIQKDDFANGLFQVGKLVRATYLLGTMREMQASGTFSLLRNSDIRDVLNELEAAAQSEESILMPITTRHASQLAYIDQRVIVKVTRGSSLLHGSSNITWQDIEIDFDAMCKDKLFQGALSSVIHIDHIYIDRSDEALVILKRARTALQNELGIAPEPKQASISPSPISLRDYKKWTQICADKMFDPQHIECMDKVAVKLDKILWDFAEVKISPWTSAEQEAYRLIIREKEEENKASCWQKMQEFGPGSLNNRRLPLCRNDHKFDLIKFAEEHT